MVERKRPWAGMEPVQIITAVTANTRLKIPKDCDPVFQRLMKVPRSSFLYSKNGHGALTKPLQMCWRQNPSHRPTFDKIVDILNDYYKTLKRYQDVGDDAFEASGKDSDDEPEGNSSIPTTMHLIAD